MSSPEFAAVDVASGSESARSRIPVPRKPFVRFMAVVAACGVCGVAVAAGGALVAARIMEGRTTGIGDIVAVVVSLLAGFPLGVCAGLVVLRRVARWPGNLARGIVGAFLGAVFVMLAAEPLRLNADTNLLLVTYALCITVFATVGFVSRH
jgi:hypothetical protein